MTTTQHTVVRYQLECINKVLTIFAVKQRHQSSSVGPRLWNYLPRSLCDGSQIRASADPGTSFSALVRSYLQAAYYSGLSSTSPVLQTAALA